jgi:hypothetical protein
VPTRRCQGSSCFGRNDGASLLSKVSTLAYCHVLINPSCKRLATVNWPNTRLTGNEIHQMLKMRFYSVTSPGYWIVHLKYHAVIGVREDFWRDTVSRKQALKQIGTLINKSRLTWYLEALLGNFKGKNTKVTLLTVVATVICFLMPGWDIVLSLSNGSDDITSWVYKPIRSQFSSHWQIVAKSGL